jgi:hypothetical protein
LVNDKKTGFSGYMPLYYQVTENSRFSSVRVCVVEIKVSTEVDHLLPVIQTQASHIIAVSMNVRQCKLGIIFI